MKIVQVVSLGLALATLSPARAHEIGHGGDPAAAQFGSRAFQAIRLVERWQSDFQKLSPSELEQDLKDTQLVASPHVYKVGSDGVSREVLAKNMFVGGVFMIEVNKSMIEAPVPEKGSERDARIKGELTIALHELLGKRMLEIDTYGISAKFRAKMDQPLFRVEEALDPSAPELLYEYAANEREGYDWSTAEKICRTHKQLNFRKYFLVYCSYHRNNWSEIVPDVAYRRDYRFVGWEPYSYYSSEVRGWWYRRESGGSGYRPVTVLVSETPYQIFRNVEKSVYGLRVYGLGPVATSPWKPVYDSRSVIFSGRVQSFHYEKEETAADMCRFVRRNALTSGGPEEAIFYGTRCTVMREEDPAAQGEPYYFVIESQNPLL